MLNTIKKLIVPFGVSGRENEIRETLINLIKPYADEIKVDTLGNLIVLKKGIGKSKEKIMLCSPMDETGFIVDYIDENGYIRVQNVGRFNHKLYENSVVISEKKVYGTFAREDKEDAYAITDYFIDIGAKSKKEAEKKVKIGDMFKLSPFIQKLQGTTFVGKPFSGRVGCAVLFELIKNIQGNKNDLYFVFTVQNALNNRGALTATFGIEPTKAIVIDTTNAYDIPNQQNRVQLSKGTSIKVLDNSFICSVSMVDCFIELAKKNNVKYQLEISTTNQSDGGSIQTTKNGVLVSGISIPTRYQNTKNEIIDLKDIESSFYLIIKYIAE